MWGGFESENTPVKGTWVKSVLCSNKQLCSLVELALVLHDRLGPELQFAKGMLLHEAATTWFLWSYLCILYTPQLGDILDTLFICGMQNGNSLVRNLYCLSLSSSPSFNPRTRWFSAMFFTGSDVMRRGHRRH